MKYSKTFLAIVSTFFLLVAPDDGFARADSASSEIEPGIGMKFLLPGGTEARCTLGFIVINPQNFQSYGLTAGHCTHGMNTLPVYWPYIGKGYVLVGESVMSKYTNRDDYGLVKFLRPTSSRVRNLRVSGWAKLDPLLQLKPILCKMGDTTDLTCGKLLGRTSTGQLAIQMQADEGDSGAPIYMPMPDGSVSATAILDSITPHGVVYATPLQTILEETHLKLVAL